jgi:hypothetical protein
MLKKAHRRHKDKIMNSVHNGLYDCLECLITKGLDLCSTSKASVNHHASGCRISVTVSCHLGDELSRLV